MWFPLILRQSCWVEGWGGGPQCNSHEPAIGRKPHFWPPGPGRAAVLLSARPRQQQRHLEAAGGQDHLRGGHHGQGCCVGLCCCIVLCSIVFTLAQNGHIAERAHICCASGHKSLKPQLKQGSIHPNKNTDSFAIPRSFGG
jgi:hypothetical protein